MSEIRMITCVSRFRRNPFNTVNAFIRAYISFLKVNTVEKNELRSPKGRKKEKKIVKLHDANEMFCRNICLLWGSGIT